MKAPLSLSRPEKVIKHKLSFPKRKRKKQPDISVLYQTLSICFLSMLLGITITTGTVGRQYKHHCLQDLPESAEAWNGSFELLLSNPVWIPIRILGVFYFSEAFVKEKKYQCESKVLLWVGGCPAVKQGDKEAHLEVENLQYLDSTCKLRDWLLTRRTTEIHPSTVYSWPWI